MIYLIINQYKIIACNTNCSGCANETFCTGCNGTDSA
jgi:hypothetical protein